MAHDIGVGGAGKLGFKQGVLKGYYMNGGLGIATLNGFQSDTSLFCPVIMQYYPLILIGRTSCHLFCTLI